MWSDVVASNVKAYDAAVAINKRLNLAEGREDFHTLDWLTYGNLMLGRFDDARANVELARAAAERNPTNAGIRDSYLAMRGRYLLETEQWEEIALDGTDAHAGHEGMPGMPLAQAGAGAWRFYAGVSAAKRGDADLAERFAADLGKLREQVAATNAYGARGVAIQEKQVAALAKVARGDRDAALALAKEAADIELTTAAPSGPPQTDEAGVRAVRRAAARGEAAGRRRARVRAGAAADTAAHSVARGARCRGRGRRRCGARAPRLLRAGGDARSRARLCRSGRRETLARRQSELKRADSARVHPSPVPNVGRAALRVLRIRPVTKLPAGDS